MSKNVFFTAAAAALIAGATLTAPAQAAKTCHEVAKVKASGVMERVKIKRECKKAMRPAKRERSVFKFKLLDRS